MKIQQIYTNCMSHAAYYLYSNNQCAIFDPLRDTQAYLNLAQQDNAIVKYVFETHFHADFVSGHLDLKNQTNAQIVLGPTAKPDYQAIIAYDNQVFNVGDVKVEVLHTPGHTMESVCYLIYDESGKPSCIITGDTLFIGDVGRPDLVQLVNSEITSEILAAHLYDSLHNKIIPLPDDLIVYPNHGAGSACGKNLSKQTQDTLGNQKKTNYALNPSLSKDDFIRVLLDGLTSAPAYFPDNVLLNIKGSTPLEKVLEQSDTPLNLEQFLSLQNKYDALILDTRPTVEVSRGFLKSALHIGLDGSFALWAGELIKNINTPILLICSNEQQQEVITRLSRVGFDNVLGYLTEKGVQELSTYKELDSFHRICPTKFLSTTWPEDSIVLDVRKSAEFAAGNVDKSLHIPLNELAQKSESLDKEKQIFVYCQGGYRSSIACSILKKLGFTNVVDVKGGYSKLSQKEALSCCSAIGCGKKTQVN
ncbi:MBL fold metallo-hydrolase [Myroides sp. LJL116]